MNSSPSKRTKSDSSSSSSNNNSTNSSNNTTHDNSSSSFPSIHRTISGWGAGTGTWGVEPNGISTNLVHGTVQPDEATGAILTPIYQSTTFVQPSIEEYLSKGYSYSRSGNPTVRALEQKIAMVEQGYGAACFSTGMAATVTVLSTFLKQGDHCILTDTSYGGTNRVTRMQFKQYGIDFSYVDMRDPENVRKAIRPGVTKLVFSESPANPTLTLTDVEAISKICTSVSGGGGGGSSPIIHCCDSTFATPVIMRPIPLGADLVVQSLTKYYDGHNMTVGGAVICKTKELHDKILFTQNMHGNIMHPHTAFLLLQTCKTMELRILRQSETAMKIAQMLEHHPAVEKVSYPGLKSFAQKALADKQHINGVHGGMLWFEVKGGTEAGRKLMNSVQRPWSLCENLGATESIITCCSVMTHANMLREDRLKVGITDGLVRVSCGIEDANDLIVALKDALDRVQQ
jgi:cystathionine beta-lyase/cystathionine gamma-synthase